MAKEYMSIPVSLKKKLKKSLPKMDKEINKFVNSGWTLESSHLYEEAKAMILTFSRDK